MLCSACQSTIDPGVRCCPKCGAAAYNVADPESERRFVTILRADLVDSTGLISELDPEQAVSRLEPALSAMRGAVRRFGGIVSKELGDGLSAVFGAPVADENHAPLACHAAVDLVRGVESLGDPGLQVRVGLHSGHVVTYMVASEFSRVYEIGGTAQHLAARLESVAEPNQICVSEACRRLADGHVRFEFLGLKPLRGFGDPLPVYRIIGVSDLSSWRVRRARSVTRFVGRSNERALLDRAARSATASRQGVLLLGDPGMGKSRLAHEFIRELKLSGWRLVEAECKPNLQNASFAALKSLLLSILEGAGGGPIDYGFGLPRMQRSAVEAMLDIPISDPEWADLEPHARGLAIRDASCAILETLVRRQPTVLLVEDLHWIDSASDVVVGALASLSLPNLLVLLTSRPNKVPNWIEQCSPEIVRLRPLDEDAGKAMLDDMLGVSATTSDLKRRIVRQTANVPLFIEEICRSLKDSGSLLGNWGDLALARPVHELGIPTSIQGVIATRLDCISREERSLLQIAAALGSRSTESMLRDLVRLPEEVFQRCLAVLDQNQLLVDVDGGAAGLLEFPHDMVRQVTYDSMVDKVRESIHARILSIFESNEEWSDDLDALCYHAMRSKDWPKAFVHARGAARKSLGRSAFANAANYFEIAMEALDRSPITHEREADAIDLRIEARVAFMGAGQVSEWFDLGNEAERRANAIDDIGRKVAAMTVRSAAQNFYGTPIEAVATGETVVRLARNWGNPGWLNLAQYGLGQAYYIAGRYREAEQMLGEACARLMEPDASVPIGATPKYLLLLCCMMKAITHTTLGEIEAGDQFQQRASALADESNRPIDRVAAGYSGGCVMLGRGSSGQAVSVLEEAVTIAKKFGIRIFVPIIQCHLGAAYLDQGQAGKARDVLGEAREEARSVGYTSTVLRASIYLAVAISRLGDAPTALNMLREARNIARQQGFSGLEAEALFGEASVSSPSDEAETVAVLSRLRAAIAIASDLGAKPLVGKAEALLGKMLA